MTVSANPCSCQFRKNYLGRAGFISLFFTKHCVKSVRIRSFSGPYFLAFGLITERYRIFLRIQSKYGKIRTRKTSNTKAFHAVKATLLFLKYFRVVFISFCCSTLNILLVFSIYIYYMDFISSVLFILQNF